MEFPTIVYRCPGLHTGPSGTTYVSIGVDNEEQLLQRLNEGWCMSLVDAVQEYLHPVVTIEAPAPANDDTPPTRAEMIAQAELIGLKVDKRWSDERMLTAIVDHMQTPT